MLSPPALAPAVAACHQYSVSLRTLTFRAVHLRWFARFPAANPLYVALGQASRYVPPGGSAAALYATFDAETAYREVNQDFYRQLNLPGGGGQALANAGGLRPLPLVMMGVHVSVSRLLDLDLVSVRQQLNILNTAQLLAPWKFVPNPTPTQLLGDAVFANGFFEGMLYPSAQLAGRRCLVLFSARLLAASRVHFQGFSFSSPPANLADATLP